MMQYMTRQSLRAFIINVLEFEGYIIALSFESKPLYVENFTPPTEPYVKEELKRKEKYEHKGTGGTT